MNDKVLARTVGDQTILRVENYFFRDEFVGRGGEVHPNGSLISGPSRGEPKSLALLILQALTSFWSSQK
jgi:hypothetical protein